MVSFERIFKVTKITFLAVVVFCVFFVVLWKVPEWQVRQLPFDKERIKLENETRTTLAQILGGAFVLAGLYFTWRNLVTTEEKQITERFTKAIEYLNSGKSTIRIGGIYALERISRDSPREHWTIMEILTSFIRENSPLNETNKSYEQVGKDIQAALTVIKRRDLTKDIRDSKLDLSNTFLREANLQKGKLVRINFRGSNLRGADLTDAQFMQADLTQVDMTAANVTRANFTKVIGLTPEQVNRTDYKDKAKYDKDL